jgi:hypothetical protein
MKGEKVFFRKKLFGGFNRDDVVQYIAKIAEERNEAIKAKEKAEKEIFTLAREIKILRGEEIEPTPITEPETTPELISEQTPVAEPESMPEFEPSPAGIDEADYGVTEETVEFEKTEIIQPVDFGFVEESMTVLPPESGTSEETKTGDSVKSKELADIDNDIAKIKEIGYIDDEKRPARVKVVKKIKRSR